MQINKVNELNIKIIKGDSLSFTFEVEDLETDLDSVYFTVKNTPEDTEALIQKSLTNGISKVTDTKYLVMLSSLDTKYLEVKNYFYDLEITIGNSVHTVIKGLFKLDTEITY